MLPSESIGPDRPPAGSGLVRIPRRRAIQPSTSSPNAHRARSARVALVLLALLPAAAAAPNAARAAEPTGFVFLPERALYPGYVADLGRPVFAAGNMDVSRSEVAESGDARNFISLGAHFGLLRWVPSESSPLAFQVAIHGGFVGVFDRDRGTDNIGWDGLYGLTFEARLGGGLEARLGAAHISSHVGDEYIERTQRARIGYTREELFLGLAWRFGRGFRLYGEAGHAYDLRNEALQEEGRLQAGLEYASRDGALGRVLDRPIGWYAAADVESMEERDDEEDLSLQLGVVTRSERLTWRLGIAYYDGRSPIGEFFQDDERFVMLGLWAEL